MRRALQREEEEEGADNAQREARGQETSRKSRTRNCYSFALLKNQETKHSLASVWKRLLAFIILFNFCCAYLA